MSKLSSDTTASAMLRELIEAGGTLPQSHFGTEWNDAGDFCFLHALTDNSPDEISITPKGRASLIGAARS